MGTNHHENNFQTLASTSWRVVFFNFVVIRGVLSNSIKNQDSSEFSPFIEVNHHNVFFMSQLKDPFIR